MRDPADQDEQKKGAPQGQTIDFVDPVIDHGQGPQRAKVGASRSCRTPMAIRDAEGGAQRFAKMGEARKNRPARRPTSVPRPKRRRIPVPASWSKVRVYREAGRR